MAEVDHYMILRKWLDGKWHVEGDNLTKTRARNLKYKLYKDIIKPDDVRMVKSEPLLGIISKAIKNTPG